MCSHYQSLKEQDRYWRHFGVEPALEPGRYDLWPGYVGTMIRAHPQAGVGDEAVPAAEAINGLFGLVPHWATDTTITKSTYNARSETAGMPTSGANAASYRPMPSLSQTGEVARQFQRESNRTMVPP